MAGGCIAGGWPGGMGTLSKEATMLSEVKAMVGGKYDGGIIHKAHVLHTSQELANPGVNHGDFTAIAGVCLSYLFFG